MRGMIMTMMAAALLACSPAPLTTDDLYGAETILRPDAAVATDVKPEPLDTAAPDAFPLDAEPARGLGVLTGTVTDSCTGEAINVLVGIARKHTCSPGKGGYFFSGLPTNVMLTLATAKLPGYREFSKVIVVEAGGTPFPIRLERLDEAGNNSCDGPKPPTPVCVCDLPTCVH